LSWGLVGFDVFGDYVVGEVWCVFGGEDDELGVGGFVVCFGE